MVSSCAPLGVILLLISLCLSLPSLHIPKTRETRKEMARGRAFGRSGYCLTNWNGGDRSLQLSDDFLPNGVEHNLRRVMEIEFLHQVSAMRINCINTHIEDRSDFLVGLSFGEQLKDFLFAIG